MQAHKPDPGAGSADASRVVVVTGASAGIGAAVARAFGRLGWAVAIGARRRERLEDVARAVEAAGGRPFVHRLDVTRAESIDGFFAALESSLGAADVVVSNAGIGIPGLLHELSVAELERELATNLLGPMLVARRALPAMLARRRGALVFVSSMNVVQPRPFQAGYTASKMGVEGLARTLRQDLEGTGVRSVIVRPGPTRTEFGAGWTAEQFTRIFSSWTRWGLMRHADILEGDHVAQAVVHAATAPPGLGMDVIQVNPEQMPDGATPAS